ncbi:hypothetical protein C483_11998 [Natrialba hulunbeirensis JCM 10989]|uniref:Uncharacterized protein n=1 Tax=Natrialba hulunbeirensis JCM 10989 TaxID=1227493 RepID=L9ZUR4_9EURY|nr:hypothetical protein [Natrialba hulunbeirensis]ELY90230.1 hypothetical protein C483_11998 [Natrialba hulunbeirensis JCM 10989]
MDRRRVLAAAGGLLPLSLAGCVSVSTESTDETDDLPDPVVEAVRVPAVAHVDRNGMPPIESIDADAGFESDLDSGSDSNTNTNTNTNTNSDLEPAGTFENNGDPGEATILLYLLESDDDSDTVLTAAAPALGTSAHFDAGERREIVFDDVDVDVDGNLDEYDAYYLEAQIGSIEADVQNDGEAGSIDVTLTTPSGEQVRGHIDDQQVLELATDETETVSFEGAFSRESYDVRAEATHAEDAGEYSSH